MKKHEKVHKLANAIKEYRGRYNEKTGEWLTMPQPKAKERVLLGFQRLDLDPVEGIKAVDGFKNFREFYQWIGCI